MASDGSERLQGVFLKKDTPGEQTSPDPPKGWIWAIDHATGIRSAPRPMSSTVEAKTLTF